jgi:hypothetical protein
MLLRMRTRVPFGSITLDDLLVLDWQAFISMQLSVETVLSRIAHCLSRKMSMRLLLPRMEKSMLIQKAVLTHDGRALVWVAKETLFDGINSILIAVVWEFNLVIGVDNSLEFWDKVKASGLMGGLILAKQVE